MMNVRSSTAGWKPFLDVSNVIKLQSDLEGICGSSVMISNML